MLLQCNDRQIEAKLSRRSIKLEMAVSLQLHFFQGYIGESTGMAVICDEANYTTSLLAFFVFLFFCFCRHSARTGRGIYTRRKTDKNRHNRYCHRAWTHDLPRCFNSTVAVSGAKASQRGEIHEQMENQCEKAGKYLLKTSDKQCLDSLGADYMTNFSPG